MNYTAKLFLFLFLLEVTHFATYAQSSSNPESTELFKTILEKDSALFSSFNKCDLNLNKTFFTDDLEFYHDKASPTLSLKSMMENLEKGLCNEGQRKLGKNRIKRELIKESLQVFPLKDYGALEIGSHYFYDDAEGRKDQPSGLGDFTHVWQFKDNQWKISRVISFNHRDPVNKETELFPELYKTLATQDSLLFAALNNCNVSQYPSFFTPNLEFYHDKGGLHLYDEEMQSVKELCQRANGSKLRRELVKGSLQVCPIKDFGAVQFGVHNFYGKEAGKEERLVTTAKFIHLWEKKDDQWKISRVISYAHDSSK